MILLENFMVNQSVETRNKDELFLKEHEAALKNISVSKKTWQRPKAAHFVAVKSVLFYVITKKSTWQQYCNRLLTCLLTCFWICLLTVKIVFQIKKHSPNCIPIWFQVQLIQSSSKAVICGIFASRLHLERSCKITLPTLSVVTVIYRR